MNGSNHTTCMLCGGQRFDPIPAPWPHSMTTAGKLVNEPLSKAQCKSCGLLQRIQIRHLGHTDFYERHYSFYERPGAAIYDKPRYAAMAEWIKRAIVSLEPKLILDAGCGRGWMMTAMRALYANSVIEGVEPSEQESENAQKAGFRVITAKVDQHLDIGRKYDLIYSANVLEHTTDPIDFLKSLRSFVSDEGLIAILCPDAGVPSAEFMFSDQNYSFTPQQLVTLADLSGLKVIAWESSPEVSSVNNKQLIIMARSVGKRRDSPPLKFSARAPDELFAERCRYVETYSRCDQYLLERVSGYKTIYNFGTSTWSLLLSAYCPNYWRLVSTCVIDGDGGIFQGKPVTNFANLSPSDKGIFVLGVNPLLQPELSTRFTMKKIPTVTWDHLIKR